MQFEKYTFVVFQNKIKYYNILLKHFLQFDSDHLNYSVDQRSEKGEDRKHARSKFKGRTATVLQHIKSTAMKRPVIQGEYSINK